MTEINNINDIPKASIPEPRVNNAPAISDEERKAILDAENATNVAQPTNTDKGTTPVVPSSTSISIDGGDKGLSADDLSRINQDMNSFKRELKEEAAAKVENHKQLESDMRAKVLRELQEENEKKLIADSVVKNNETVNSLQSQIKALQEKVSNPQIGQEVPNKSPFENEKAMETMSPDDERRLDEASRLAFMNERFGKL